MQLLIQIGISMSPRGIVFNSKVIDKLYLTENGSTSAIRIFESAQLISHTYNPGYYIEQYTPEITNKVTNMTVDTNNCIYFTQEGTAGVFKIQSSSGYSNTSFTLMPGSNTFKIPGNGILLHGQGVLTVSCADTHNIYKHDMLMILLNYLLVHQHKEPLIQQV